MLDVTFHSYEIQLNQIQSNLLFFFYVSFLKKMMGNTVFHLFQDTRKKSVLMILQELKNMINRSRIDGWKHIHYESKAIVALSRNTLSMAKKISCLSNRKGLCNLAPIQSELIIGS